MKCLLIVGMGRKHGGLHCPVSVDMDFRGSINTALLIAQCLPEVLSREERRQQDSEMPWEARSLLYASPLGKKLLKAAAP